MIVEWYDRALASVEGQPDVPLARGDTRTKLTPRSWELGYAITSSRCTGWNKRSFEPFMCLDLLLER